MSSIPKSNQLKNVLLMSPDMARSQNRRNDVTEYWMIFNNVTFVYNAAGIRIDEGAC